MFLKTEKIPVREFCVPDDVVVEILTRIPAHYVLKFQGVCKKWKDLISTQYFQSIHLIRSKQQRHYSSMITLLCRCHNQVVLVDKWDHQPKTESGGCDGPIFLKGIPYLKFKEEIRLNTTGHDFLYSHDGLIVIFRRSTEINVSIYNPITGEIVTIKCLNNDFDVLALFYNPWVKAYCLLLETKKPDVRFEMLNLSSRPFLIKTLKRPNVLKNIFSDWFYYGKPVVIDDKAKIYWDVYGTPCEQMIMYFNIKTEEFDFLPHPLPHSADDYCMKINHRNMKIVNSHGNLSLVHIEYNIVHHVVFNVWTLKDETEADDHQPIWTKIHKIVINVDEFNALTRELKPIEGSYLFHVIAHENGELLVPFFTDRLCLQY